MTAVASADIYQLADALRQSSENSEVNTQEVLVRSATYIKQDMESRAPVDTGKLRQSISIQVDSKRVIIGPHTDYAGYVEFGTKPHVIRAKNKKSLMFIAGGKKVFVKKVNHPGTKAQPYVRPAFEDWVDSLGALAAEANVREIERAGPQ